MSSAKRLKKGERDLEIVCNLLWKNKYGYDNDRCNIVGMYDVPSTTLDWETFKAYLLKNSGNPSVDLKVSFIDSNDKEIRIETQKDYQLALYSFRKRARNGEIITLKLEKIDIPKKSACVEANEADCFDNFTIPPSWFLKYMKKFKKEMIDDISSTFVTTISKNSHQHTTHHRKSKVDMYKRSRKYSDEFVSRFRSSEDPINKLEMKIENKLEKLENKNHRLKAKSKAMKLSSDSDAGVCPLKTLALGKTRYIGMNLDDEDEFMAMDATAVNRYQTKPARMLGGKRYLQKWDVINTGTHAWNNNTELRFAWGSELLKPVEKTVCCPQLLPGEKGEVYVSLNVPDTPGNYESYWHFYHFGRRFGHWLGCQVIVDQPSVRKSYTPPGLPKASILNEAEWKNIAFLQPNVCENKKTEVLQETNDSIDEKNYSFPNLFTYLNQDMEKLNINSDHLTGLKENTEVQISSDSDNLSIISMSGGNSLSSDLFEYVAADDNVEVEDKEDKEQNETKSSCPNDFENLSILAQKSDDNELEMMESANINLAMHLIKAESENQTNLSVHEIACSGTENPEYAYIYYNGEKYPFHKKYLNEEYFKNAEKADNVQLFQVNNERPISQFSHLSYYGSLPNERSRNNSQNSENRLFVFPRHSPGFEVVYPTHNGEAESFNSTGICGNSIPETFRSWDSLCTPNDCLHHGICWRCESGLCENHNMELLMHRHHPNNSLGSNQSDVSPPLNDCSISLTPNVTPEVIKEVKSDRDSTNSNRKEECKSESDSNNSSRKEECKSESDSNNTSRREKPKSDNDSNGSTRKDKSNMNHPRTQFNSTQDNLLTGAAILASSAMSTARNMMSIVMQNGEGHWVNGHWVSEGTSSKRENGLRLLAEMGFLNRDLNATLLARYTDDIQLVVSELVQ